MSLKWHWPSSQPTELRSWPRSTKQTSRPEWRVPGFNSLAGFPQLWGNCENALKHAIFERVKGTMNNGKISIGHHG